MYLEPIQSGILLLLHLIEECAVKSSRGDTLCHSFQYQTPPPIDISTIFIFIYKGHSQEDVNIFQKSGVIGGGVGQF